MCVCFSALHLLGATRCPVAETLIILFIIGHAAHVLRLIETKIFLINYKAQRWQRSSSGKNLLFSCNLHGQSQRQRRRQTSDARPALFTRSQHSALNTRLAHGTRLAFGSRYSACARSLSLAGRLVGALKAVFGIMLSAASVAASAVTQPFAGPPPAYTYTNTHTYWQFMCSSSLRYVFSSALCHSFVRLPFASQSLSLPNCCLLLLSATLTHIHTLACIWLYMLFRFAFPHSLRLMLWLVRCIWLRLRR